MNSLMKKRWLEALRSNNYRQGTERLATIELDGTVTYCCLGVLCDLVDAESENHEKVADVAVLEDVGYWGYKTYYWKNSSEECVLPEDLFKELGLKVNDPQVKLPDGSYAHLSALNDRGSTFEQIADLIEEQL